MPFSPLGLGPKITKVLREQKYTEPTPIQAKAVPLILEGRDIIGVAQTGTGKTAAFVLPLLERLAREPRRRGVRALVVAPTRELVAQIDENVRIYGRYLDVRSMTISGGVSDRPQIGALKRGVDIVVATPGRLIDLMSSRHITFGDLDVVVLDEADRMLDMGFLPAIRQILAALPEKRQTLLFSATLSDQIEKVAAEFLKDPSIAQIGRRSTAAEAVSQWVVETPRDLKNDTLIHLLTDAALEMVLVFSRTKHGADKIARKLDQSGVKVATLHSNRTQGQRAQALSRFRSGEVRVLVATDIAARGIDVDGISHVINYDFPPQPEDYVHRIGRTGRAHAIGDAVSFVTPDDRANLQRLERFLGRGIARKRVEGVVAKPRVRQPAYDAPKPAHPGARRARPPHEASRHGARRFGQGRRPR